MSMLTYQNVKEYIYIKRVRFILVYRKKIVSYFPASAVQHWLHETKYTRKILFIAFLNYFLISCVTTIPAIFAAGSLLKGNFKSPQ